MRLFRRGGRRAAVPADVLNRLDRLEAMVEGLQDAMYREGRRQHDEMEDLRDRTRPHNISKALSDDARRRGL